MLNIVYLFAITHNYMGSRKNGIFNKCEFDIVRIKKENIKHCFDYGDHVKYCDHSSQPSEFVITNERGINKNNIVIKPSAMYEEINGNKYKMADFYYSFECNSFTKGEPTLIQHIVPTPGYDVSIGTKLIMFLIMIMIVMLLMSCCDDDSSSGFMFGYLLGSSSNNSRRTYCE